ncbi:MAG: lyase family protein, partial [Candidatus Geothermarchaeales archaeon]
MNPEFRVERDPLGAVDVPMDAYYGAQTQRAVENFPVSRITLQRKFIRAQAIIKKAAAIIHTFTGRLDKDRGEAIVKACNEILEGKFYDQFVVDVYQAGAGTSQNMNINEVVANRANELLGGEKGEYSFVHPNDHVNMAQSTNDTFHVATHVAALEAIDKELIPVLKELEEQLHVKA